MLLLRIKMAKRTFSRVPNIGATMAAKWMVIIPKKFSEGFTGVPDHLDAAMVWRRQW
ncbi:hypothetical protein DOY81_009517 [Sarcophaga bullata]|nr:hypothetical protein DOY81_009517 [Sarcophaga bullata]